jgi:predicted nucleotidyltransferase
VSLPSPDLPASGYARVLGEATTILDRSGIPHVVFGSIALKALGRPRPGVPDEDIDLMIRPPDANPALRALENEGFVVEETDPSWLNKATRSGVSVDLIFRTAGEMHLDDQMLSRAVPHDVDGTTVRLIPAEDLAVMKAVLYEEHRPFEWFDALALISRPDLDWDYLVRRAVRHGAQRVLSLLLYARSSGVTVPGEAVDGLVTAVDR